MKNLLTPDEARQERSRVEALATRLAVHPNLVNAVTALCWACDLLVPQMPDTGPGKMTPTKVAAVLFDCALFSHLELAQVRALAERLMTATPDRLDAVAEAVIKEVKAQADQLSTDDGPDAEEVAS